MADQGQGTARDDGHHAGICHGRSVLLLVPIEAFAFSLAGTGKSHDGITLSMPGAAPFPRIGPAGERPKGDATGTNPKDVSTEAHLTGRQGWKRPCPRDQDAP